MSEFDGKVAVISGGGGGIGRATAARLLEQGARVVLSSRRREVLDAARAMVKAGRGGAIVNIGSMWAVDAITATPTSAYSAAQAGRHALTKNLAIELAPHQIRVNTVALAFVETPAYERFMTPEQAREVLESVNAFHPLGRHGYPADVVEA